MPRKMARQTLERHAGACDAGSLPYLGSGLLGSPENRYIWPPFGFPPGTPGLSLEPPPSLLGENTDFHRHPPGVKGHPPAPTPGPPPPAPTARPPATGSPAAIPRQ